ncbi:rna-directed dna polymerase from mobile element jockey-like [Pitangus sulphuratus]|nr:rna-directed dna polymerase from mobile element jockey-like [Pitangus sulphuratus]
MSGKYFRINGCLMCPELKDHDCKNYQLPSDPEIVQDLLLKLDPYKSMGPDGIHPRILKELADFNAKTLSMIFEQLVESREVPADWKLANIVSIFKKGNKEDPRNYRPVSVTSVPGKVMEKIILAGIEKHLKDNTGIDCSQHRFMRGKHCLPNLISFCGKETHLVDQENQLV